MAKATRTLSAPQSRRNFLANVILPSAAALPLAAAGIGTASAANLEADADLFRAIDEFAKIATRITAAHRRSSELHDVYESLEPPVPEVLKIRSADQVLCIVPDKVSEHESYYRKPVVDGLREMAPMRQECIFLDAAGRKIDPPLTDEAWRLGLTAKFIEVRRSEQSLARAREIVAAWDEWRPQCEALQQSIGINALEEEKDALYDQLNEVEREVWTTPAVTIEGAIAKAFVVLWCHGGEIDEEELEDATTDYQVSVSLVRDITNMATAVPACIQQVRENEAWELARIRNQQAEA